MRTIITSLFLFPVLSGCLLLVPPFPCGDGVEDNAVEEECDDGNVVDADGCEANCKDPVCENDIEDPGEICQAGIGETNQDPLAVDTGLANAIAAGDIDDDGNQDLIVVVDDTVTPFLGDGTGDFTAGAPLNFVFRVEAITVADVNGDGAQDLVGVNSIDQIRIALGDGNGGFAAQIVDFININTGNNPAKVVAADINNDGTIDIVTTNNATLTVVLNPGDIAGGVAVDLNVGNNPSETALADIDGDGELDLVVSDANALELSLLLNLGDGVFDDAQAQLFNVGTEQTSIAAGDFDSDGNTDVVVGLLGAAQVAVLLNTGGAFGAPDTAATGLDPIAIAVGDLDLDGDDDIATADNGANQITVLVNDDANFANETLANQDATNAVIITKINGDNVNDILSSAPALNQVTVSLTFP